MDFHKVCWWHVGRDKLWSSRITKCVTISKFEGMSKIKEAERISYDDAIQSFQIWGGLN